MAALADADRLLRVVKSLSQAGPTPVIRSPIALFVYERCRFARLQSQDDAAVIT